MLASYFLSLPLDVRSQRYRKSALNVSDARVSLLGEVIDGIKTVKLSSLGKVFQTRVDLLRDKELKSVRHALTLNAYNQVHAGHDRGSTWGTCPWTHRLAFKMLLTQC